MAAWVYVPAALFEIGGCFAFWAWLRLGRSAWYVLPGIAGLILFAWLLTFSPASTAGRSFAVYGGIYIVASLAWSALVERVPVDRFDILGAAICLVGAAVILWAPRGL